MRYRYDGDIEVKCAGHTWTPGETFETHLTISNPHFHLVKPKRNQEAPEPPSSPIPEEAPLDGNDH